MNEMNSLHTESKYLKMANKILILIDNFLIDFTFFSGKYLQQTSLIHNPSY